MFTHKSQFKSSTGRRWRARKGKVLVMVGLMLTLLLSCTALAVDLGLIMWTRAQLQLSSDAGSLAAGTELLPGLGVGAFRTPSEVQQRGEVQAVQYVGFHPAGDASRTHIDPARDMRFGQARFDREASSWIFDWGPSPFNAVWVGTMRSSAGSQAGDGPLPLIFARVMGFNTADVNADSVAVIMPANGFRVPPGSLVGEGLSPFAFSRETWDKYWRARADFEANRGSNREEISMANDGHLIMDEVDGTPLYYEELQQGNQTVYRQLFADNFGVTDPDLETASNIVNAPDGILEMNIFPLGTTAGNFGTVNIGVSANSTQVLRSQILNGITEQQMSGFPDGTLTVDPDSPMDLTGNTGISAGIEQALAEVVGQKRAILLYDTVVSPGNNAIYTLVELVGIRFMDVNLNGNPKTLTIQPDSVGGSSFVADLDAEIGEDTTVFSSLILAR